MSLILALLLHGITAGWATESPLTLRVPGDPTTLDWNRAHSSVDTRVLINIMEGLVSVTGKGEVQPCLAKSWKLSSDGRSLTFELDSDRRWSDGVPLTAQQFVDSWVRVLKSETRSSYAHFLFPVRGARDFNRGVIKDPAALGFKATSPSRLEIQLEQPSRLFLQHLSFWALFPIRLDLIKKFGTAWTEPKNLAVIGSYTATSWKKETEIVLEKNPKYPVSSNRGPQKVVIKTVSDDDSARELLKNGSVDLWLEATTEDILKTRSNPEWRAEFFPYLSTYYLGFNHTSQAFKFKDMREAIAFALNRADLPPILQGGQTAADQYIPRQFYQNPEAPYFKPQNYSAKAALARAGHTEGSGLSNIRFLVEKFDQSENIGKYIAEHLRQVLGLKIDLKLTKNSNEYSTRRAEKDFDIYLGHWGADFPDPVGFLEIFRSDNPNNHLNWKDSGYDAVIDQLQKETSDTRRLELIQKAETILLKNSVAILPLFFGQNAVLAKKRVRSLELDPLNYLFFKSISLETPASGR